jgi:hypothetical protein
MLIIFAILALAASLSGADNKAHLRYEIETQAGAIRDLRVQVSGLQATARSAPSTGAQSGKRHEETMAAVGETSAELQEIITQGAEVRQLVAAGEEARNRRAARLAEQTASEILAARLQVGVASALVLVLALQLLVYSEIRRSRRP